MTDLILREAVKVVSIPLKHPEIKGRPAKDAFRWVFFGNLRPGTKPINNKTIAIDIHVC